MNNRGGLDPGGEVEEAKAELAKTQKLLSTEKLLKQQAVNKLAEIMNRKDFLNQGKKNKAQQSQVRQILFRNQIFDASTSSSSLFLNER